MNREITFRGKTKDGEWVYGFFFINSMGESKIISIVQTEINFENPCGGAEIIYHDVFNNTVGQFTGLVDKNDEKIYEGDICTQPDPFDRRRKVTVEIKFEDGSFVGDEGNDCQVVFSPMLGSKDYKIVGNIHDKKNSNG